MRRLWPRPPLPGPRALPEEARFVPGPAQGLLLTEEDLAPDWLFASGLAPVATATCLATTARSPLATAPQVCDWARAAMADCTARHAGRLGPVTRADTVEEIVIWARRAGLSELVTARIPIGPTAERFKGLDAALAGAGIALTSLTRPLDAAAWPHATHGFFRFRDAIPELLGHVRGWRLL